MHRALFSLGLALLFTLPWGPARAMPTEPSVAQACAQRRVGELPVPFADVDPNHWAFTAVMTLYYCGAYRGGIPRKQPASAP